jgi:hypothetical protein
MNHFGLNMERFDWLKIGEMRFQGLAQGTLTEGEG